MRYWLSISCLLLLQSAFSQEEQRNWDISGYVKDLVTFNVTDDSTLVDNLIHNRLNFSWDPKEKLHIQIEARNRLFYGDLVNTIPNYGQLIDSNNDYLDLSYYAPENRSWLFHTMIDRAYVEWYSDKWEIRGGRQRINWGVNLVWNPNDIFNTYSFFDFDYEERPGSDAVRIKRFTGFASSMEVAVSAGESFDEMVMAGMYKFNAKGYDFQMLAGKAREDIVAGIGWAGNLSNAGLKGEVSYFSPYVDNSVLNDALLAAISFDYSFENSLYLHSSYLFNSEGQSDVFPTQIAFNTTGRLTARDLSPFRHSTFLQASYPLHPLVSAGLATIYYPSAKAFFINPSVTFSTKPNLDIDLIGQLYYDDFNNDFGAQVRLFYARVKWSF